MPDGSGHTLFLLCYYPNNNKKIPKYVILDPMAQFSLTCRCRQIQSDIKNDEWVDSRYMNYSAEQLTNKIYNKILPTYYTNNNNMINRCTEYSGFLNIPLEDFFVYSQLSTKEMDSNVLLVRDTAGAVGVMANSSRDGYCALPTFLKYIYSADKFDHFSSLRKQVEYENKPWYNKLYGFASGKSEKFIENMNNKYKKIQGTIVEKCDKITDETCMDIPIDIEFSDDDFMGFGN